MSNYGNQPYPIVRAARSRKRRKRAALAGAGLGTAALFGTRRGKRLIGSGLKHLGNVSPGARRVVAKGLGMGYRGARSARGAAKSGVMGLFAKSMNRFPTQTAKVGMTAMRAGSWLNKAKAWAKMIPRF